MKDNNKIRENNKGLQMTMQTPLDKLLIAWDNVE